jgi:hypothetical protein
MNLPALPNHLCDVKKKLADDIQASRKSQKVKPFRLDDLRYEPTSTGIKYIAELILNLASGGWYFSYQSAEKVKEYINDVGILYEGLQRLRKFGENESAVSLCAEGESVLFLGQKMQGGKLSVYVSENDTDSTDEAGVTADELMSFIEHQVQENIAHFLGGPDSKTDVVKQLVFNVVKNNLRAYASELYKFDREVQKLFFDTLSEMRKSDQNLYANWECDLRSAIRKDMPNYLSDVHRFDKRLQKIVINKLGPMGNDRLVAVHRLAIDDRVATANILNNNLKLLMQDIKKNIREYMNCFNSSCDESLQSVIIHTVLDLLKSGDESQKKICKDFISMNGGFNKFLLLFPSWVDIREFHQLATE